MSTDSRIGSPPRPRARRDRAASPRTRQRRSEPPGEHRRRLQASFVADDFLALLRDRPLALRRRPHAVQARPDGAPRAHLDRSAAARPDLAEYGARLRRDAEELDAFLDRVTINVSHLWRHEEQFEVLRTVDPARAGRRAAGRGSGAPARPMAPRRTRSPRSAARSPRTCASRSTAPTWTAAWSPGPRRGASPWRMPAPLRLTCSGATSPRCRAAAGRPSRNSSACCVSKPGTCCVWPCRAGRYDVIFCRNTVIYFTEEVRDALHERLVKALAPGRVPDRGDVRARGRPARPRADLAVPLRLPEDLMETSEYLPMFLAEGREHLQELNLAVVRIEETPDDQETVDEIFRIAHSMKGMSATMGFAGMAALTHEMEDVFELLRQRRGGLAREAIDVLLECLDALSAATDAIDETGAEAIQPEPLIERLRNLIRERDAEEPEAAGAVTRATSPDNLGELADGRRVVQVIGHAGRRRLDAVRARLHGAGAIAELGETLACVPAPGHRRRVHRAARSSPGWCPSAPTPSCPPPRLRARGGRRARSSRPSPDAAVDAPEAVDDVVAPSPAAPRRRRRARRAAPAPAGHQQGLLDRPRRRRAARPAHALHGRARAAPHAGGGAGRAAPTCPASRRPCRTSPAPPTPCRRWSCRCG